jgi:virulence factor Mce-like protein
MSPPARDRKLPRLSREQLRGLTVLALGALLLIVAFTGRVPLLGGKGGRIVLARFAQANEVNSATPVRIGGVDVGLVDSLRAAPGNSTTVAMRITSGGVQLHDDASAQVRWRTLLGGSMYIDLDPGSPSAPSLGGEIPLTRTGTQVDWDQLNGQLPSGTRRELGRMLAGFRAALQAPRGEGATIRVLGPALSVIGAGSDALRGTQSGELPRLVRSTASTVRALSADTGALQRLVGGAEQTLAVTAAHNSALAQAIELSPAALDSTRTTTGRLDVTLSKLDPLIARLRPGARELGPATRLLRPMLDRTDRVLRDALPLLHAAPPALAGLGRMSAHGTPLLGALTPTVNRLNTELIPWLGRADSDTHLRLYETIGPLFSALSSSLGNFDTNGYSYNFNVQFSTGSLLLPCDTGPGATHPQQCLLLRQTLRDVFGAKR